MENVANNKLMNVVPQETSYIWFVIVAIILVVLAAISVFVLQWKQRSSPWWSDQYWWHEKQPWYWPLTYNTIGSWWSGAPMGEVQYAAPGANTGVVAKASTPERSLKTHKKESWCFVGEDLTGRFCVQVPSEKSCDTDRLFGTRKDCELTPANHMATGIVKENGESMLPLAKMRFG